MKNLILILVLLFTVSLFAQDKDDVSSTTMNEQTDVWMTKISSDSEMREMMMGMMIEKTKGSEEEMQKLINIIIADPEMSEMITNKTVKEPDNKTVSIKPRGMTADSPKTSNMYNTPPVQKK
jgi:hypothetical protein